MNSRWKVRAGRLVSRALSAAVFIVVSLSAGAGRAQTPQTDGKPLKLSSVKPTVLFTGDGKELRQLVDVVIENGGQPVQANLDVRIGSFGQSVAVDTLKEGTSTFHVSVPDVRQPMPAQFVLKVDSKPVDTLQMDWQPRKHWTIYFIPITHHDLGYTDTIENVMNRYASFYDDVLRFCDQTSDWPEEAKYRYTIEGAWSLQHFVATRPKEA
ncbi:MAG: hypothetical protein JW955_15785, partial [Sedimentisphaerales bacterium]|nr:hypothetical protein [Sedimentisphaerales bacterium]